MALPSNNARLEDGSRAVEPGPSSFSSSDRLARNLGWFSIGLGIIELLAAEKITRALGSRGQESLVRAFGIREITSGIITLTIDKHAGIKSRIVGDALDIAALAAAMRPDNRKRGNAALALLMVAGITVLDVVAAGVNTIRHTRQAGQRRNYDDRSGFPKGVEASHGAARKKLEDLGAIPGREAAS